MPHGRSQPSQRLLLVALAASCLALPQRDARGAELLRTGTIEDSFDPAYALLAPSGIAASPDGRSVYVASFGENAIDVFARNIASGWLVHQAAMRDGQDGISGLGGVLAAELSRDGRNLYAVSVVDESVVVFSRDPETGLLAFAQRAQNGVGGVSGMSSPRSLAVSPDGRHVYVPADAAVVIFARDDAGLLSFVDAVALPPGSGATGVALDEEGRNVYVGGYQFAELREYARDADSGELTLIGVATNGVAGVSGLAGVDQVLVTPDGRSVYANGTSDSSLVHFARDPDTGMLGFVAREQDGVAGVDGLGLSAGATLASRDARIFAGGADALVSVFARDRASGALAFATSADLVGSTFIGNGGQLLAVGGHLYVANSPDDRVAIFGLAALHWLEAEQDGVAGANGLGGAEDLAVSPDLHDLYVTGTADNSVTAFRIDMATGALTATQVVTDEQNGVDGIAGAIGVTVAPNGKQVYVAGSNDSAIAVFARDRATGALSFLEREKLGQNGVVELLGPRSVTVSPDGRFLYSAVFGSNAVTWFARDRDTGALTFAGFAKDGVGGVDGLAGAYGLALSPDGKHLYAAGLYDDSLVVFSRNLDTGALALVERKQNGVGGVDGLGGVGAVAVSPDGRHVYTTALNSNAVAVFARDPATGALSFVERKKDNEGNTLSLNGPYDIAVSGDGRLVLVTSSSEHALDVFRRDPATGRLFLTQLESDGVDGVGPLATPHGIALAGGVATYVASHGSNAVAVFTPEPDGAALAAASLAALAALARRRAHH